MKPPDVQSSSRRAFLKRSAATLSATAAGGLAISRSAHAAGDEVIRVGMIGCGGRGTGAAAQAMSADPGVRLVAMADLFEDRLLASRRNLREKKPAQVAVDDDHCFVGFDAYRKVVESGVDVVLIANASRFHARHLKACVDAGKHTFVEKPAAVDPPDVKTVLAAADAAAEKGLSIVSGLMCRYNPGIRETVRRVHDGAIGEILAIQETTLRPNFRLRKRLPGQSEIQFQLYNWTHFSWLSGDFLTASLVHHTDKAGWIMHEEQPRTAFGMGGRSCPFGEEHGDCFDHYAVVYQYAGGVKMYAYLWVQPGCYREVSDVVIGTTGQADLMKHQIEGKTSWRYEGPNANPYQVEHDELFASVRSGKPINNGRTMALSTMTGILGQIACYTGKKVAWDEAIAAGRVFGPADCDFSTDPPVKPNPDGTYPVPVPGVTRLL
ncbi:MAG: Gfo/Idh/MocA family protein [Planctomycetota bacterium]|jgi:predicted dehydrogenase